MTTANTTGSNNTEDKVADSTTFCTWGKMSNFTSELSFLKMNESWSYESS